MTPYSLPHIFVVFHPGTGGNFIVSILHKILNNDLSPLVIEPNGSAHNFVKNKNLGTDYISYGTLPTEQLLFNSENDRLEFYRSKILESNIDSPRVVWTHDYTNIPLYKREFPNSKVLVITQWTMREKLSAFFMNITKAILNKDAKLPFTQEQWEKITHKLNLVGKKYLIEILGDKHSSLIENIYSDESDPRHKILVEYSTIVQMFRFYRLYPSYDSTGDLANTVLYLKPLTDWADIGPNPDYIIGNPYIDYITDEVTLEYRYMIEKDVSLLVTSLEQVLQRKLTTDEFIFVKHEFENYYSNQNKLLLTDPLSYFDTIRNDAYRIIQEITN